MGHNERTIKEYIKKENKLNDYRVNQEYENIRKYLDIEEEFTSYIENGWSANLIKVEGYTAKVLFESYPLTVLGAYNYLISLRENPSFALEALKNNLPRR